MAKYSNTVEYNIKTTLDSSGIAKLQSELTQLKNFMTQQGARGFIPESSVTKTLKDIEKVQVALRNAFNPKLGMLNTSKFMSELKSASLSLNGVYNSFATAGTKGIQAFTSMYGQISKLDTGLRSVSKTTDKIMNTIGNTMRWGLVASGFSQIMNAAHQAVEYTKELDTSLTNIMMVSGETRDNMNEFAKSANEVAQRLGATTTQMTEAAKIFVQQGMSLQESSQMGEYAVHLANISEQDSATTSDELTAMKNAFKINIDDMGNAISKWAAIANNTAVDMEELSVASQKAASVANTTGVTMEQFAGHIAAIEATTREAPENIGNGLKTLYSRFADIKLGETLEDGVDLGKFSEALQKVGVEVLDTAGNMRNVGDIIEDTMAVWQQLDKTQQNALATTVAGRFQLGRFEALMNSQDIYQTATGVASAETGTATYDKMQDTYRESLEGRSKALQAKIEEIFNNLFTTDQFGTLIDGLSGLVDVLNDLIEATGGGETALLGIATALGKLAQTSMSRGIANFITNRQADVAGSKNLVEQQQLAAQQLRGQGLNVDDLQTTKFARDVAGLNQYAPSMNLEQQQKVNELITQRTQSENALSEAIQRRNELEMGLRAAIAATTEVTTEGREELVKQIEALKEDGAAIDFTSEQVQNFNRLIASSTKVFAEFNDKLAKNSGQIAKEDIVQITRGLTSLVKQGVLVGKTADNIQKAVRSLNAMPKTATSIEHLAEVLQRAGISMMEFQQAVAKLPATEEEATAAMLRFERTVSDAAATNEFLIGQFAQMEHGLQLQSITNAVLGLANAGMTAVFAYESLKNLFTILADESKSPWEKLEAGMMDFTMVIAMGIPAVQQIGNGLKVLKQAILETAASQQILTAIELEGEAANAAITAAEEAQTFAVLQARGAKILEKDASLENVVAALAEAGSKGTVTAATITQIAEEEGVTVAKVADTAATMGLTIANEGLLASLLPLLAAAAPFIAIAAAIGGSIGLIVYLVGQAEESFHRFDAAVEQANQKVQIATEGYENAAAGVNDLNSALKDLENANPFEGLTRGTQEWTDALTQANNKILDLIEKYPELADYVGHGNNGELTLSEQGLENVKQIYQQRQAQQAANVIAAKQQQLEAKSIQSSVNILRDNDFQAVKNAAMSSQMVMGVNGMEAAYTYDENAAAATIQQAAELMASNVDTQRMSTEDLTSYLQKEMGVSEEVAKNLAEQVEPLTSLGNSIQANTAALEASTNAYAAQIGSQSQAYQNADAQAQNIVDQRIASRLSNPSQTTVDNAEAAFNSDARMNWDTGDMQKWYADLMGYASDVVWKAGKGFVDSADQVILKDSGDMWQTIHDAYVQANIADQIGADVDAIVARVQESLENLKSAVGEKGSALFAGNGEINGSALGDMTLDDFKSFESNLANVDPKDLINMGFGDSGMLLDGLIDESEAEECWRQFAEAFNAAAENNPLKPAIDTDDIKSQIEALSEEGLDPDIDASEWKNLTKYIANAGSAIEGLSDGLKDNVDAAAEAAKEILRYDSALSKARKNMDSWKNLLENASHNAQDAAKAHEELSNVYSDLLDLASDDALSAGFTTDSTNLELLEAAMNGDIEAYDQLAQRAAEDIVVNAKLGTEEMRADVQHAFELLDQLNLGEINVGDPVLHADGLEEQLNNIIAAAGLTAEEVQSLLATMGLDAELETEQQEEEDPVEYAGLTPTLIPQTFHGTMPVGNGKDVKMEPYSGIVYGVSYSPQKATLSQKKTMSAFGLKVTAANGASSGGKVSIKHGSITKASSGSTKWNNASSGSGSTGAGAPSSGGSGGGNKGGGKSKTEEPKKVDYSEGTKSENDIYNKINKTLEQLAQKYERLTKVKSRAWGSRWVDAAKKEIKNLQETNKALKERINIAKAEAKALAEGKDNKKYGIYTNGESLAKYKLTDTDNDGIVDNYQKIYAKAKKAENKAQATADAYFEKYGGKKDADGNTIKQATMTEEQEKQYKKLVEKQKAAAEHANKILEITNKYQEAMKSVADDTETLKDNEDAIEDIVIEVYNKTRDIAKELTEMRRTIIDIKENFDTMFEDNPEISLQYNFERFESSFKASTASIAAKVSELQKKADETTDKSMKSWYETQIKNMKQAAKDGTSLLDLNNQNVELLKEQLKQYEETGVSEIFGTNEQAMWEALTQAIKDAEEFTSTMKSDVAAIYESITAIIDDMYDAMADRKAQWDQAKEQYEYLASMTELIYGEKAYADQMRFAQAQAKLGEERLKDLEKERQTNHEMLEQVKEELGTNSAIYQKALEKEREIDSQILSIRKEIAESYKKAKQYANELAIQNWLDNFQIEVEGVMVPLEYGIDAWERIKENASLYLDELNRAAELTKLQNKYLAMINDTTDANIQQRITQQMEEQLGYLREKTKLSQYDVNYANAQLEILQKTLALEDARNAKNSMKLRRDSQGNYNYVYTANQTDVKEKENDLLEAQMNAYNMSVEEATAAQDRYLQKIQNMADQLRQVANDDTLTKEQIAAITADIISQGYEFLNASGEQLSESQKNAVQSFISAAELMAEENAQKVGDISASLIANGTADAGLMTDLMSDIALKFDATAEETRASAEQTHDDIVANIEDFEQAVSDANANIKQPLDDIDTQFGNVNDTVSTLVENAQEFYNLLEDKSGIVAGAASSIASYQSALTDADNQMSKYRDSVLNMESQLEAYKAENANLNTQIKAITKAKEDAEAAAKKAQEEAKKAKESKNNSSSNSSSSNSSSSNSSSLSSSRVRQVYNLINTGAVGNEPSRTPALRNKGYTDREIRAGQAAINHAYPTYLGGYGDMSVDRAISWAASKYDSGGYTGIWGSSEGLFDAKNGKLAILHEKELVLNADDTENILSAVNLVRELVTASKHIDVSSIGTQLANASKNNIEKTIEQRVDITAEFPNANSTADIEQALMNLSNNAYQHAYATNNSYSLAQTAGYQIR